MQRHVRSALRASCLLGLALTAAATLAQKPDEPLGELLDAIPLPEAEAAAEEPAAEMKPPSMLPPSAPAVAPGNVLPVALPPSAATGEMQERETAEAEGGRDMADAEAEQALAIEAALGTADESDAAAEADAAWAARQEQRRAEINAVESPIVDQLNARMAARAEAEGRRFAEEQAAYERSLVEHEAEIRRREAEHAAEMEAYTRRVARERAAHRARVEACLAGNRDACGR